MLHITVRKDGTGDFRTVAEAVSSVPYDQPATVSIGAGVFVEKLFVEKRDICLIGSGMDSTVLRWADGAFRRHADGTPTGTFRSYTAFLGGGRVSLRHMTVENAVGDGALYGQGIAVYADAARVYLEDVALEACQDTLFCAPLPALAREPRGFCGPRALAPRVPTRQVYRRCRIAGDVDFIFGGADAVFDGCTIVSRDRGKAVNGYVAAPCGEADGLGFVFRNCAFTGLCAAGTVYLGRPWREHGKAVLLGCTLGAHIHPAGWIRWPGEDGAPQAFFAEHACMGEGVATDARANWSRRLTDAEAAAWHARADALMSDVARGAASEA